MENRPFITGNEIVVQEKQKMKVLVIGATGATGRDLVDLLIKDKDVQSIEVFARRKPDLENDKLTTHVVDFDKPDTWKHLVKGDLLFSCLGTTLKAAGSKEAQYKVDYLYQYRFAKAARENGVKNHVLVSAGNASAKSLFFYSRMKGELEDSVKDLGFEKLIIMQPPLLVRKGSERKAEVYAEKILSSLHKLGLFKWYKPMPTHLLAKAMIDSFKRSGKGTYTLKATDIMNNTNRLYKKLLSLILISLAGIVVQSCVNTTENELEPGESLGISSVPNLRDLGGYKTTDGATVKRGLVYRSNQLYNISETDMVLLADLNLENDFDLRTSTERNSKPDELPVGVNNVWLDVMADFPTAGPANMMELLSDPLKANEELGNGKVEALFKDAYRQFITLPSAQAAYRELFMALIDKDQLPALFHCTTGKDRTGWAAASLLTLLGVPKEVVMEDYLRSNQYILPMYEKVIEQFIEAGGDPSIPTASLGVKEEYLNAALDEVQAKYGSIENYFSKALGISANMQDSLRDLFLK